MGDKNHTGGLKADRNIKIEAICFDQVSHLGSLILFSVKKK